MSSAFPVSDAHKAVSLVLPVVADDGARCELILLQPPTPVRQVLFWMPAMGVPARHYLPLAHALSERGIAVALFEWRGIGSSDHRAGWRDDWAYCDLLMRDIPASMAVTRAHYPDATYWLGGHSLGGQLACLYASLHPGHAGIALVASGAPYWRLYSYRMVLWLAYALAPVLARSVGHLPGRRIGFGGNEARGVITDWARSGRTGRYVVDEMDDDFEARLATLKQPLLGLRMAEDWFVPQTSLDWLLGKMPLATREIEILSAAEAGGNANHFSWMKHPDGIARHLFAWIERHRAHEILTPTASA